MKTITLLTTALFCTVVLTACGGGGSEVAETPSNPTTPTPSADGKLVIDNGRGTTNNQDTERVR